jgi:hypothetical protein
MHVSNHSHALSRIDSSHLVQQALTEMTRQLRKSRNTGTSKTGLVLANGGVVTYQHVVCLSSSPRRDGLPYPDHNPLPTYVTNVQTPPVDEAVQGEAIIEVSAALSPSLMKIALTCCRPIRSSSAKTATRSVDSLSAG